MSKKDSCEFHIIIIILVYLTAHQHISCHTASINNMELQIYFGIKYNNNVKLKLVNYYLFLIMLN